MGKYCFFVGHRDASPEVVPMLTHQIEFCIRECGITHFIVGQYGLFDQYVTEELRKAKKKSPHIKLFRLIAYHPSERKVELPCEFDDTYYPDGQETVPKRLAIVAANKKVAVQCDLLIVYVKGPGNARNLMEFATQHHIPVINLADTVI